MADLDLAQMRVALDAEATRLQGEIYNLTRGQEDPFPAPPESDLNQVKGDQADQAEPLTEYERNREILAQLRALLGQVNAAIGRISAGTYGRCLRCGREIDPRRLAVMPWAAYDAACQDLIDRGQA
jgi:RNA polymerase-binding transcription factor DksA